MKLGVAVGEYKRPLAAVQECVNMYPEKSEQRARGEVVLRSTPGAALQHAATYAGAGLWEFNEVGYELSGDALYSIAADGTPTLIGLLPTGGQIVGIDDNGNQLLIVVGGTVRFDEQYFTVTGRNITAGYIYDGTTLTQITDVDFPLGDLRDRWYFSDLSDGSSWQSLSFATAESKPDPLRGHVNSHDNILFLGTKSLEFWTATGDPDLPFQRAAGSSQERGCLAEASIVQLDNTIFFLGDDRVVYKVLDFRPVRASDHGIERWLASLTLAECHAARAFSYTDGGHYFYCLSAGDETHVLDVTMSQQFEVAVWHDRTSNDGRWWPQWFMECYGIKFGLAENGLLGSISTTIYTEFDASIYWLFTIGPFAKEDMHTTCTSVTLLCTTGSTASATADPAIELRVSKNLGRTWYSKGMRTLGKMGDYLRRICWRRIGEFPATTGGTLEFSGQRYYDFCVMDVVGEIK